VLTAVISDIHGNAEALRAVLDDIDRRGAERIICLGDIIGYGPDPLECVDLVRKRCAWSLMGNHDFGVLYEPTNFNPGAESAAFWTREQFDAEPDETLRAQRYEFLGKLRVRVVEPLSGDRTILAVHGSPRRPINEYIFPDDVIETLQLHAEGAERRAQRTLFDGIDWRQVIGQTREAAPGDWVRILHAVLRRKARQEAAHEDVSPVTTANLKKEVERFKHAEERLRDPEGGNYL